MNQRCMKCGIELLTNQLCGQCLQKRNPLHETIPTFIYQELIKDALLQFKFHNGLYLSRPFSRLMHHQLRSHYKKESSKPDGLICIPLHTKKMRSRGYNQSQLLTKHLSRFMNILDLSHHVKKIKNTSDQSSLALNDRKKNIKNAFVVLNKLPKHIAIIDDVMTTGETVKALAYCLKKKGVKTVDVWCLARTSIQKF